ncbi:hypothetical protein H072_6367 [Dactylellina haptotyla CBS 200.50]|uniref:Aminoglycoside phosphotransferase domain-containing protein n=1 Tax=Dactylellina haptotyla (strain CBS 200.50) TaxID=1284197 RepID=S8AAG3_DACHA|nr:hypothetical protein H072_6367 [Dactylellina haptotyla CBS 200.50]
MARIFAPLPCLSEHLSRSEISKIKDKHPIDTVSIGETLHGDSVIDVKLCRTSKGRHVIVKAGTTSRHEANFMSILKHAGLTFTPDVYGYYRVIVYNVLVMEYIPGMDLTERVWKIWSKAKRQKFKLQLADALIQLRKVSSKQIETPYGIPLWNFYGSANEHTPSFGPYKTEEEYNTAKLDILSMSEEPESRIIGEQLLAAHYENKSKFSSETTADEDTTFVPRETTFVATHTDLFEHNIRVDWKGNLKGIIDFGKSGFYPDWAEYAFSQGMGFDDWWKDALNDVMRIVCPQYTRDDPIIKFEGVLLAITDPFSAYWKKKNLGTVNHGKCNTM